MKEKDRIMDVYYYNTKRTTPSEILRIEDIAMEDAITKQQKLFSVYYIMIPTMFGDMMVLHSYPTYFSLN